MSTNPNLTDKSSPVQPGAPIAFINDKPYSIEPGDTILKFVRRHLGNQLVPTLCDAPNLEPFGSCRVCSVDVALVQNGPAKTQASCHTPVIANSYSYGQPAHQKTAQKHHRTGADRSPARLPHLRSQQQLRITDRCRARRHSRRAIPGREEPPGPKKT